MNARQRRTASRANKPEYAFAQMAKKAASWSLKSPHVLKTVNANRRAYGVDPAGALSLTIFGADNEPIFVGPVVEHDFTNMWIKERPDDGTRFVTAVPVKIEVMMTVQTNDTLSQVQHWLKDGEAHYEMGPDGSYVAICDGAPL